MPRLTALKNNSKSIDALNTMMGDDSPLKWISKTLETIDVQEGDLPWKRLLLNYEEEIRVLASHRNFKLRYHGCSILLYSKNENSRRQLWEMFRDNERKIRILMISLFQAVDRHRLYNTLFKIYLNDPVSSVRDSAYNRIRKDFSDLYSIQPTALNLEEKIHCLELLNLNSSHDHNLALQLMNDPHPGVILAAGLHLEKSGTLDVMLQSAKLKDMEDLKRRLTVLQTAADHQLCSFLEKKENLKRTGSLYIALSLYESGVQSSLLAWTLEQIFKLQGIKPVIREIKERALKCLVNKRDPESLVLVRNLLSNQSAEILPYLLEHLPPEGSEIYYPVLKNLIMDIQFPFRDSLLSAFRSIPISACLSDFYLLVRDRGQNIEIRRRALTILSSYGEYSSTLFLLENLDLMNKNEMKELGTSLAGWNRQAFDTNVSIIFSQPDSSLHQSLMQLLGTAGNMDFITEIEDKLLSPEADTRITALRTLQELKSLSSLNKMEGLFFDTNMKVQAEAAAVFIRWDKEECFLEIQNILEDSLEYSELHDVILKASEQSENKKLLPIIAALFKKGGIPQAKLINALKEKKSFEDIRILTSLYNESDNYKRDCLRKLFIAMGNKAEDVLMTLLSKNEYAQEIREIFEKTGYTERQIVALKSPFTEKRKQAAEALCLISTQRACRGLLSAARDISTEIRRMSLRALAEAQESRGMLSLLKEDSDKKIKRLAFWAESKIEKAGTPIKE